MNARRTLTAAADALCAFLLTVFILAVVVVATAMATVDRGVHAPAVSQPANGISYATTYLERN